MGTLAPTVCLRYHNSDMLMSVLQQSIHDHTHTDTQTHRHTHTHKHTHTHTPPVLVATPLTLLCSWSSMNLMCEEQYTQSRTHTHRLTQTHALTKTHTLSETYKQIFAHTQSLFLYYTHTPTTDIYTH